jgi:murein DD-endopeptidase MepM/ murein hydrolase activator NlpD
MLRRLATIGIAVPLLTATMAAAPQVAQAAARDGVCDTGEFCLYYNSDQQGSVSDFAGSITDYGATQPSCYVFNGAGAGKGLCVKNHAASVWNRTSGPVTVYFNSNYAGVNQSIAASAKANLNASLKNQNASHKLGTTRTNLSYSLYNLSGGSVTCGFNGYVNTPGHHEGIDIARGIDSPVRALVSGQVINVVRGARGGSGLSTIAVYNASYDKTILYLHSAPLSTLAVGQTIGKGQQIAKEDWRGISSSTGRHTHVEMRLGRRTLAAKSVNDPVLENPDPTSFWNARGYNVR